MQGVKNVSRNVGCLPYTVAAILFIGFIVGINDKESVSKFFGSLSGIASIITLIAARKAEKIKTLHADMFERLSKDHNFDSVINSITGTEFWVFDANKRVFFAFSKGTCTQYVFDDVSGYEFHWVGGASGGRRQCRLHLHMNAVECPLLRIPLINADQMDLWSAKLKAMQICPQVSG